MEEAALPRLNVIPQIPRHSPSRSAQSSCRNARKRRFAGAIFCTDDNLALGAMQECRKHGIRMPDDISIMATSGIAACASFIVSVATATKTGKLAAEKILACWMRPRGRGSRKAFSLVLRQSTSPTIIA